MNRYAELKNRQRKEFNKFPLGVAFSKEQFKGMMEKWGLTENDTDKIFSLDGGCFIRKTDESLFFSTIERFEKELADAIAEDKTGDGFIREMFVSELGNHEYGYTGDLSDTLDSLNYTLEEVNANPALKRGLELAMRNYRD